MIVTDLFTDNIFTYFLNYKTCRNFQNYQQWIKRKRGIILRILRSCGSAVGRGLGCRVHTESRSVVRLPPRPTWDIGHVVPDLPLNNRRLVCPSASLCKSLFDQTRIPSVSTTLLRNKVRGAFSRTAHIVFLPNLANMTGSFPSRWLSEVYFHAVLLLRAWRIYTLVDFDPPCRSTARKAKQTQTNW